MLYRLVSLQEQLQFQLVHKLRLFLMTVQGTVTLIPSTIPDVMHWVLSVVKMSLLWYWKFSIHNVPFGLLGELHPGLPLAFEEHDLQGSEKMGLVGVDFSTPMNLIIAVRDRHEICSTFILNEVGFISGWSVLFWQLVQSDHSRPSDAFAQTYFDVQHDVQFAAQWSCTSFHTRVKCVMSFVCESEMR